MALFGILTGSEFLAQQVKGPIGKPVSFNRSSEAAKPRSREAAK